MASVVVPNRVKWAGFLDRFAGLLTVLVSFALYLKTLAPTITWGDPAKLTIYAHDLYLNLLPSNHALHTVIGWLWGKISFVDYAFGQNLLSAVFSALTIGVLYQVLFRLTGSQFASVLGALSLAVSHTFWWLAVVAESYSLLFFLLACAVWFALLWGQDGKRRWLYLAALTLGLSFSNHHITLIFLPAFALYIFLKRPSLFFELKTLLVTIGSFALGVGVLIFVFFSQLMERDIGEIFERSFYGAAFYWVGVSKQLTELPKYLAYLLYQFPSPALLLGIIGAVVSFRKWNEYIVFLAALFVSDVLFSAGYLYQRQFEILVPSYIVFALFVGLGMKWVQENLKARLTPNRTFGSCLLLFLTTMLPVASYYTTPSILGTMNLRPLRLRTLPYRNNEMYFFLPDKSGYFGAAQYGKDVLNTLPPRALLLADFSPGEVVRYLQSVEGMRPDITVVRLEMPGGEDGHIARQAVARYYSERPVYLTDYRQYPQFFSIDTLGEKFELIPEGHLFRLREKSTQKATTFESN